MRESSPPGSSSGEQLSSTAAAAAVAATANEYQIEIENDAASISVPLLPQPQGI